MRPVAPPKALRMVAGSIHLFGMGYSCRPQGNLLQREELHFRRPSEELPTGSRIHLH